MNSNQDEASQPRLCASGCGFFGNPATSWMCSRCYRESKREATQAAVNEKAAAAALCSSAKQAAGLGAEVAVQPPVAEAKAEAAVVQAPVEPAEVSPAACSPAAGPASEPDERPVQKNPGRCFSCGKRVGLTGFKCRCDYVFCSSHRYAEAHNCTFDYKKMERQRLAKNNPLVQASKVDKL